MVFSKNVGAVESNEAEVLAILKALQLYVANYNDSLVVESDLVNAIHWGSPSRAFRGGSSISLMRSSLHPYIFKFSLRMLGSWQMHLLILWPGKGWTDLFYLLLAFCDVFWSLV